MPKMPKQQNFVKMGPDFGGCANCKGDAGEFRCPVDDTFSGGRDDADVKVLVQSCQSGEEATRGLDQTLRPCLDVTQMIFCYL